MASPNGPSPVQLGHRNLESNTGVISCANSAQIRCTFVVTRNVPFSPSSAGKEDVSLTWSWLVTVHASSVLCRRISSWRGQPCRWGWECPRWAGRTIFWKLWVAGKIEQLMWIFMQWKCIDYCIVGVTVLIGKGSRISHCGIKLFWPPEILYLSESRASAKTQLS